MSPYYTFPPPEALTTEDGHYATVTPVVGGRFEGKWQLRIERSGQKTKILHTDAAPEAVREKMAKYLHLPLSSITMHFGDPEETKSPTASIPRTPVSLSTDHGHYGSISLVRRNQKRMWELNIKGPMSLFESSLSEMTVSTIVDPSEQDASLFVSQVLHVPQNEIKFHYEEDTDAPLTPTLTNKPLDKFEFSPNGRATCHTCHERIAEHTQRVGIQEWKEAFKHWQPVYYHRNCCTNDMLESLDLGGKRKWEEASRVASTSSNIESKLKAELDRQDEQETSKRRLVYGKRGDLREDLRRMRMELANQLEVESYKIFTDATLDDIVATVPSNEKELIKCRGIAQKRCDRYGGAILQVISQHQMMDNDE